MRTPSTPVVAVVTVLLAAGCGASSGDSTGSGGDAAGYVTDGTFTIAITDDPGAFDPYHSHLIKGYYKLAYDSLLHLRPDGEFVSGLAEEWTADAEVATFTLREGVTCSDGTPLTASQIAADLNYAGDPANQSSLYGSQVPSVPYTATGDDTTGTVTVTMEEPFGFLLHTVGRAPLLCANGLANPDLLATGSDGTGPFVLTDVVPGQSFTFTRRDDYAWGPDGASTSEPGTPAKVVLRVVTNPATAANLLLSGEVNMVQVAGPDAQRLDAEGLTKVELAASGAWLWFNQIGDRPTGDVDVRTALVQALDLDEVIRVNTGETGGPSTGLAAVDPRACPGDTVAGLLPEHDVAAAGALLDEAGWTRDAGGTRSKDGVPLALDLRYVPSLSSFNKPTAELIAGQWEAIGVDVTLTGDTAAAMNQTMFESGDFDVYMQGFGASLPSQLVKYVSGPVPPAGTNLGGVHNDEYERLVARAQAVAYPEACAYWDEAEKALWRNLDLAPLADRPLVYYLNEAEAEVTGSDTPIPTSIRVLG